MSVRLALFLPLLGACAATVKPPADPEDPRPVFILDHGHHATLVVVDAAGRPVRYAFGDLNWGADGDIGFYRGMGAMLMPDSGTLGRRVLDGEPTLGSIAQNVGVHVEKTYCLAVASKDAFKLQRALNMVFEENLSTAKYNAGWNLEFVEHPENYWFGETSNEAVEKWLEAMGCEVQGIAMFSNWRVKQPDGETPAVCLATPAR